MNALNLLKKTTCQSVLELSAGSLFPEQPMIEFYPDVEFCPDCGSNDLYYEGGLITGYIYHCVDCDYVGSFVIEKEYEIPKKL